MEKKFNLGYKKVFLVLFVILLAVCAIAAGYLNKRRKISGFVTRNISALEEIANAYFDGDDSVKEYQGVEVEGVYSGEHSIVEFYYGGYGIAPSSTYYGFYYSPEDIPVATAYFMNYEGYELTEKSSDEWVWKEISGDNGCQVVKITDKWYYYRAWF